MITLNNFKKLYPRAKDPEKLLQEFLVIFPEYKINTPERIAAFISQCGHESAGWRKFEENLNYSAKSLNLVFPKYFIRMGRSAEHYARKPEQIANVVYSNRMGNGPEYTGDGWKFRGRGPIQLTGRNNYRNFSTFISKPEILDNPDIVSDNISIGLLAAVWFWIMNGLNELADTGDVKIVTRRINGGTHGLEDRINRYNECIDILKASLKLGSSGDSVKEMQKKLNLVADGDFGPKTENAVKSWQKINGLSPDGIVGFDTLSKIYGIN